MPNLATMQPESPNVRQLPFGRRATVIEVVGNDLTARRLMEIGVIPGAPIEVLGRAPFGDPIALRVDGCRLAVRGSDACRIRVSECPPS